MFATLLIVLLSFNLNSLIHCEDLIEEMVGVETKHKINKDTVINQHMTLKEKFPKKTAHDKQESGEPDWTYSPIPEDVSAYVADFKRNMSECLKEVQQNDKRTVKRLSPKQESPVHGDCLIACVFKRNEVILNGKINKGNLITLAGRFYAKDTKVMKKLEKNLDRCIQVTTSLQEFNKDECALAARLNECTNDLMSNNKHKIEMETALVDNKPFKQPFFYEVNSNTLS